MISMFFEQFPWLGDALWQSTLLLAGALVIALLLQRRTPALAHMALTTALVMVPATILLSGIARLGEFGLLAPIAVDQHAAAALPDGLDFASSTSTGIEFASIIGWFLITSWSAISLMLIVRIVISAARGASLARTSASPDEYSTLDLIAAGVRDRLGVRRDVVVRVSDAIQTPVIWCWSRPAVIILPTACAQQSTNTAIEAILAHELAHLKRRDHWTLLLAELGCCLVPWQPLAWLARRSIEQCSEVACDQLTVFAGANRHAFALQLLQYAAPGRMHLAPTMSSRPRDLRRRIEQLVDPEPCQTVQRRCTRVARVGMMTSLVLAGLCMAGMHRAAPQERSFAPDFVEGVVPVVLEHLLQEGAGIAMLPGELDLGEVAPGGAGSGVAWIVNIDTRPIAVTDLSRSCGCTIVDGFEPRTLGPGESMTLQIVMEAPDEPDTPKTKNIIVSADGQDPIRMPIHLRTSAVATTPDLDRRSVEP